MGDALRALQQRSGRTLRSLETEVMISDSSLSRYLRGSTVPPWATVRDLCRALGADPAEYRALWEAADRQQPRTGAAVLPEPEPELGPGPGSVEGPEPVATGRSREPHPPRHQQVKDPASVATPPLWLLRARSAARRLVGFPPARGRPWAWAAGGVCAGLLCALALALVGLWPTASTSVRAGGSSDPTRTPTTAARPGTPAGGGSGSAPAAPQDRIFVNRVTGNCLDHSLDQGLRSYAPNGMSYQKWSVRPFPEAAGSAGAGTAMGARGGPGASTVAVSSRLRNHATGACLETGPAGLRGVACSDTAAGQRWVVTTLPDASAEVRHRPSGTCLDDGPAGLRAVTCDGSARQRWG
ncbi:helix-turn-helix domain-containing protein [Streptomyces sp. NPDC097619]|uniref:helix-turn-helix domain-containing protein n=1 Tax=Streptomyces sp. NPDC097619 TaxID=3157228 RepID=UPI00332497EC